MFKTLFLWTVFVLLFLDLGSLVLVGKFAGALWVMGLLFLNAMLGFWLIRRQGIDTIRRVQGRLMAGELPALELLEGVMVLLAGLLFFMPGFVSDLLALFLLIPPVRRLLGRHLLPRWMRPYGGRSATRESATISAEYRREK